MRNGERAHTACAQEYTQSGKSGSRGAFETEDVIKQMQFGIDGRECFTTVAGIVDAKGEVSDLFSAPGHGRRG